MIPGTNWVFIPNGISVGLAVFAQLTVEWPYALQRAATFPPSYWGIGPHLIHGYLAHPSHYPKRHVDRRSRFRRAHQRDQHTDRHTDRPHYSVYSSRPPSLDATQPNNTTKVFRLLLTAINTFKVNRHYLFDCLVNLQGNKTYVVRCV